MTVHAKSALNTKTKSYQIPSMPSCNDSATGQCVKSYPGFKLFALIVDLTQAGEVGLGLVLEEGVMQHLVVDVQLAHLGLHAVPLLLLQLLVLFLFLKFTEQGQQPGMRKVPLLLLQWTEQGQQSGIRTVLLFLNQFPSLSYSAQSKVNSGNCMQLLCFCFKLCFSFLCSYFCNAQSKVNSRKCMWSPCFSFLFSSFWCSVHRARSTV